MSLKHFHVFFIVAALAMLAFMTWWAGSRAAHGMGSGSLAMALCSAAGLAAGLPYLGWFLKKAKTIE